MDFLNNVRTMKDFTNALSKVDADQIALSTKLGDLLDSCTYGDLVKKIKALGNALIYLGAEKGSFIGILSENRNEWAISYLAIASIGAVIVPFDSFAGDEELSSIIGDIDFKFIFVSEAYQERVERLLTMSPSKLIRLIRYNDASPHDLDKPRDIEGLKTTEDLTFSLFLQLGEAQFAAGEDLYSEMAFEPDHLMVLSYIHEDKFAMISHQAIIENIKAINRQSPGGRYGRDKETCLALLPFHHTFPAMTCFLVVFSFRGHTVIYNTMRVRHIIDTINRLRVSFVPIVPLLLEKLSNELIKKKKCIDTVRAFICGGAPLDRVLLEGLEEIGVTVLQGYGLTEYSPVVSMNAFSSNRIGSVGKALPGVTVKLIDPDSHGNGQLLVKGPSLMTGYFNKPKLTLENIDGEGWLHTGDIAQIDADGFVYITGRIKKMIVTKGGKNIFPQEIETLLERSDAITKVKVVRRFDQKRGEYPFAMIQPDPKAIEALIPIQDQTTRNKALTDFFTKEIRKLTQNCSAYKRPTKFSIVSENIDTSVEAQNRVLFSEDTPPVGPTVPNNLNGDQTITQDGPSSRAQNQMTKKLNPIFYLQPRESQISISMKSIHIKVSWTTWIPSNWLKSAINWRPS